MSHFTLRLFTIRGGPSAHSTLFAPRLTGRFNLAGLGTRSASTAPTPLAANPKLSAGEILRSNPHDRTERLLRGLIAVNRLRPTGSQIQAARELLKAAETKDIIMYRRDGRPFRYKAIPVVILQTILFVNMAHLAYYHLPNYETLDSDTGGLASPYQRAAITLGTLALSAGFTVLAYYMGRTNVTKFTMLRGGQRLVVERSGIFRAPPPITTSLHAAASRYPLLDAAGAVEKKRDYFLVVPGSTMSMQFKPRAEMLQPQAWDVLFNKTPTITK
ncbi:hypothetical protein IWQ60_002611 [Tieghemiomyces parasiticus]|uniref:Uncharacterized protein n=1 Tax=Tieghemiomyces parasiticus TaxID=78921 RepID=A0A9W8AH38_9FUNG|nr:hypothetical protein IWQ60_002611 [Tieghemiomyces parasiticus]